MYHDQGHIPMKLLDFANTVNVTLGIPIIRTSVDHGTAFDIAGRGIADPTSMKAAIRFAGAAGGRTAGRGAAQHEALWFAFALSRAGADRAADRPPRRQPRFHQGAAAATAPSTNTCSRIRRRAITAI